jgi:hypothetical protein
MKINNYKAKLAYRFMELLHNNGKSYRNKLRPQHEYFFEILIRHGEIKSQTPSGSVILTINSNLAFQQFAPRTIFNYVHRLKSAGIIINKVCGNKPDCTIELASDFKICLPNYNYVVPEFLKTNPLLISLFEKYFSKYKSMPLPGAYELERKFMNAKRELKETMIK